MNKYSEDNYLKKELYELIKNDSSIFDFIQDSVLDGMWYWDLENPENEWMNERFWRILGYNPKEMPHSPEAWQGIINKDDLELALKNFNKHCENPNHPYDQIVRYTHKTGKTVWIRCRGLAIRNKEGKPIRMLGAHHDISKLKENEFKLYETNRVSINNKQKIETLIGNLQGVVYQCKNDKDWTMTYLSDEIKSLSGYNKEDILFNKNTTWNSIILPEYREHIAESAEKAISRNEQVVLEYKIRCKDGSEKWVWEKATPTKHDGRECFEGFISDITSLKENELKLKKEKEKVEKSEALLIEKNREVEINNNRLESLLRISQYQTTSPQSLLNFALSEIIKLTNSEIGYIYYYNEESKQFTLNTWSNNVMKECAVLNPQTVYQLDKTGLWGEAVRQRKPIVVNDYTGQNDMKKGTPKGHVKLNRFLTIPVFINEEIVAVSGVANKKTNYNDADIRQMTLMMDSVWKILEKTKLLNDLTIAKEKAEESSRLKSEFLNNLSHEVRTPMNGIIGFSNLLENKDITEKQRLKFIKTIKSSSNQLLKIIDDILEISFLKTNQKLLNINEVCLYDIISELIKEYKPQILEKGITSNVYLTFKRYESRFKSDKEKIIKIIESLISNAIKYTIEGKIEIYGEINNNNAIISVKDTGIGISPENQKIIFEEFSQEDKEMTRKYGGLGLGLSIAQENARLLNGSISIESEKGKGSTFTFSLPIKQIDTSQISKPETKRKEHEKLAILVAEDEDINYLYIETLFDLDADFKYELIHAHNGKEAFDICMSKDIDIVLMDIKMPIMNGHEATLKIKESNPNIPIIAQTAYSTEEDKKIAFSYGCDDFISKPIKTNKLFSLIKKHVGLN